MLSKLLGLKKKESAASTAPVLSYAVQDSILGVVGANSIPSMPASAQKAFELSTDPGAELRDFVKVIESDEALSARVLKIANSVYFERGKPSNTIEESVIVIGMNEIRSLLNATTLCEIFPTRNPLRTQFWTHDLAVAIVARALAQRIAPAVMEAVFLGGLMHDVGKLLLIQRAPTDYAKILESARTRGISFGEAESQLFPFDHTEVGLLIAQKWRFSQELQLILRQHNSSLESYGKESPLFIVGASNIIVHSLGLGHPTGFSKIKQHYLDNHWPVVSKVLGLSRKDEKELLAGLQRAYETEKGIFD